MPTGGLDRGDTRRAAHMIGTFIAAARTTGWRVPTCTAAIRLGRIRTGFCAEPVSAFQLGSRLGIGRGHRRRDMCQNCCE